MARGEKFLNTVLCQEVFDSVIFSRVAYVPLIRGNSRTLHLYYASKTKPNPAPNREFSCKPARPMPNTISHIHIYGMYGVWVFPSVLLGLV